MFPFFEIRMENHTELSFFIEQSAVYLFSEIFKNIVWRIKSLFDQLYDVSGKTLGDIPTFCPKPKLFLG